MKEPYPLLSYSIIYTREVLENALDSTVTRYGDPSNRCHHRYDILGARYIPCKMMRAVLTHPLFTVKTQYVQSFLKPWNVIIKETNTSFPYWLSSLFFSLKSLIFSQKNGSETRIYLTGDFPPLEPTRSHIPKIPLKHSLSQNCWDTFVSPCPLNVGVQGLVTEPRLTALRGMRGAREGKKQRLVKCPNYFYLRL